MGIITNLVHMSKNNKLSYSQKQKTTLNDKYYNYHKMRHFKQDYKMQNFRLAKKKVSDTKQDNVLRFK